MSRRYMVAGNWKMNGSLAANAELVAGISAGLSACADVEVLVCPPAGYLTQVKELIGNSAIKLGAQNLSDQAKPGAFTGEMHGQMLSELGATHVIVGHSERRSLYGETNELVAAKVQTAQALGLTPVLCVGETLEQRDGGQTESVLKLQLETVLDLVGVEAFSNLVVAYEPVWAIGTGRTASAEQAQDAHAFLRGLIAQRNATIGGSVQILYGGSVKPGNAAELFAGADVDGGLIGGASLKSEDFLGICRAAQA
mgnify:CR=1 FL=1|tara:strand:- start:2170 stop:2931 length:762 start_codon:yes stop_codon:yes gene_type:complete